MSYFLMTITVIGLTLSCVLYAPLYVVGFAWPKARWMAEHVLQKGIWFLMKVQPWLDLRVSLPAQMRGKILLANHRSHLDVFLFLAHVPGIHIMAKSSLFKVPFLGIFMRTTRQIPVIRGDLNSYLGALELVKKHLAANETVMIFPEMTRAGAGQKGLQEFRLAPFKIIKEGGFPIVPVAINGTQKIWPRGSFRLKPGSVTFTFLREINPALFEKSEDLSQAVRASLEASLFASTNGERP